MSNVNGRLAKLETTVAEATGEIPAYGSDALRTWGQAVRMTALVADRYAGDREAAIADFDAWPAELRVSAFSWGLSADLGPLLPDRVKVGPEWPARFRDALACTLDAAIMECGIPEEEINTPEGLTEVMKTVVYLLDNWEDPP